MIHKISKAQYLSNPCKASSVAFWKNNAIVLPNNIFVYHLQDIDACNNKNTEYYFRLMHNLKKIDYPKLDNEKYNFQLADINKQKYEIIDIINQCYLSQEIYVDINDYNKWIKSPAFNKNLWIFIYEKFSKQPVALGIADFDISIKEGSLEWVQVLPLYQNRGLGKAIVNKLLLSLKRLGANFVTVSGKKDGKNNAERVYRSCNFNGNDIWCISKTN